MRVGNGLPSRRAAETKIRTKRELLFASLRLCVFAFSSPPLPIRSQWGGRARAGRPGSSPQRRRIAGGSPLGRAPWPGARTQPRCVHRYPGRQGRGAFRPSSRYGLGCRRYRRSRGTLANPGSGVRSPEFPRTSPRFPRGPTTRSQKASGGPAFRRRPGGYLVCAPGTPGWGDRGRAPGWPGNRERRGTSSPACGGRAR